MPAPDAIANPSPADIQRLDNEEQNRKLAEANAKKMQETVTITPTPLPKNATLVGLMETLPFFSGLLSSMTASGSSLASLATMAGKVGPVAKSAKGLQGVGIALDILNFVRIPATYLAAAIFNKKGEKALPITLSNNAKWLYSGVLLTATVVALVLPVTAPFLAIGAASLAVGVSLATIGKVLLSRHNHKTAIKALDKHIGSEAAKLDDIKAKAAELETSLKDAITAPAPDEELIKKHMEDITSLHGKYEHSTERLQRMHDRKHVHQARLDANSKTRILDKSVGVLIGGAILAGIVTSLFFPPIGLAVILAASSAAVVYAVGRLVTPILGKLGGLIGRKLGILRDPSTQIQAATVTNQVLPSNSLANAQVQAQVPSPSSSPVPNAPPIKAPVLDNPIQANPVIVEDIVPVVNIVPVGENNPKLVRSSSAPSLFELNEPAVESPGSATPKLNESVGNIARLLYGSQGANTLNSQITNDKWIDQIEARVKSCVEHGDHAGILQLFKDVASHGLKKEAIDDYLASNKEEAADWRKGVDLLKEAVDLVCDDRMTLSKEDRTQLLSSPGLQRALPEKVNLQRLTPAPDVYGSKTQASPISIVEQEVKSESNYSSST